ncbi:hypothetical protein MMC13_001269 [Lambiella insularis]|nr:hypothetical protein [Lambiella insularis]
MSIEEKHVELFNEAQLSEDFLCNINAKGQVPVLAPPSPAKPIPDSLEITHYLAEAYPSLVPESHRAEITRLLTELHGLNYFTLCYSGKHFINKSSMANIQRRLDGNISEKYRKALEYKKEVQQAEKVTGLQDDVVAAMVTRTKELMQTFNSLLTRPDRNGEEANPKSSQWMLGLTHPTALDAHLITFVARMREVNRGALIPENLGKYADSAMEMEEWKAMMDGRGTMAPPNAGPK